MFGGFQKGEMACLLIRKIFEGLERTVGGSYFFLFTGEGLADRRILGKGRLIPVRMRKMLKSSAEDKLVSDGGWRPNHSPRSPPIPQPVSN